MTEKMFDLFAIETENYKQIDDFTNALKLISNCPHSTEMLLEDFKRIILSIKSLQDDIESLEEFSKYDDICDARREFYNILKEKQ